MKKNILIVFGTRPEAIKMAPLVLELKKRKEFQTVVCVTGQHREMLDQVLSFFKIVPDIDLNIMQKSQGLFDITSKVLLGLKIVIEKFKPDLMLVHGDTTTSLASALAGFYSKVKIAHVEAGLRTRNLQSPWPEEANRQMVDDLSDLMFAPTVLSKNNLLEEGKNNKKIFVTGNTVIDSLFQVIKDISKNENEQKVLYQKILESGYGIKSNRKYVLITGHRRESFGEGFLNICNAIKALALKHKDVDFVYPVHLSLNVRKPVKGILSEVENVYLLEPLEYKSFIFLLKNTYLVLTDSGGIQEEAPSLGKPVLVMREVTERQEAVESGTVKLVGTNIEKIVSCVSDLLIDPLEYEKFLKIENPYGDGTASIKIVDILCKYLF